MSLKEIDVSKCGTEFKCFRIPADCYPASECQVLITVKLYKTDETYLEYQMYSPQNWVAVGHNTIRQMVSRRVIFIKCYEFSSFNLLSGPIEYAFFLILQRMVSVCR